MLTAANFDLRQDPGVEYPLHVRVLWRNTPGPWSESAVASVLENVKNSKEDPDATQRAAGTYA